MDTERLSGKHVLITGAARGMGAAVAKHYAAQGAKVCVGDIDVEGVTQVAKEIRDDGGVASHVELNVTSEEDAEAAVAHTVDEFGSINVLVNNAGINKPQLFLDITRENYERIMQVNAWGKLNMMQAAARQMKQQGPQDEPYKIIHVGSILSREAFLDVIPYAMSKHAVLALIKGGAKALVEHNITVNGYAPGVVRTELWEQLDRDLVDIGMFDKPGESMDKLAEDMILLGRYSYPEDVIGTASFLASSESDYMTGQLLMIDGGMVIQ